MFSNLSRSCIRGRTSEYAMRQRIMLKSPCSKHLTRVRQTTPVCRRTTPVRSRTTHVRPRTTHVRPRTTHVRPRTTHVRPRTTPMRR
ncbi:hypothetical protein Hanom_Chr03g00189531 [Helianthus anomalus]